MVMQYTNSAFYKDEYLQGRSEVIPTSEFPYWSMQASAEIRKRTFESVDQLESIPDVVQICCCEVAEKLYRYDAAKGDNGMVLQSYGNDGDTGTYKTDDLTDAAVESAVSEIIGRWLLNTGLMYCGVDK